MPLLCESQVNNIHIPLAIVSMKFFKEIHNCFWNTKQRKQTFLPLVLLSVLKINEVSSYLLCCRTAGSSGGWEFENGFSEHPGGLSHLINTRCGLVHVLAAWWAQRQVDVLGEAPDAVPRKWGLWMSFEQGGDQGGRGVGPRAVTELFIYEDQKMTGRAEHL